MVDLGGAGLLGLRGCCHLVALQTFQVLNRSGRQQAFVLLSLDFLPLLKIVKHLRLLRPCVNMLTATFLVVSFVFFIRTMVLPGRGESS